ncbi:MAG: hypothetical protein ACRETD_05565, partial [Steroidobacteraceae bacterium]
LTGGTVTTTQHDAESPMPGDCTVLRATATLFDASDPPTRGAGAAQLPTGCVLNYGIDLATTDTAISAIASGSPGEDIHNPSGLQITAGAETALYVQPFGDSCSGAGSRGVLLVLTCGSP